MPNEIRRSGRYSELRATDWADLIKCIHDGLWNDSIGRFRSTYAYRGMSSHIYSLEPSIHRLGEYYEGLEENLIKQFEKYASEIVDLDKNIWRTLSIGQHYGLPTRLLDWTYSPQIALHFATCDLKQYEEDGVIWRVNFDDAHKILTNEQKAVLTESRGGVFTFEGLKKTFPDLKTFNGQQRNEEPLAIFFEPPTIDSRISNQFAYFSIMSDRHADMAEWLLRPEISSRVRSQKVIIPKEIKWEIRDKLDLTNINERLLFPGLGGLCSWLSRHYVKLPEDKKS
ncbi:MAG: FRG domain-containing protein [Pseudomonadota bacterium]